MALLCALRVTTLLTVFIKKTLIFSTIVDQIHLKMFPFKVKYRVAKKTGLYSIDLLLISQIYLVISSGSNKVDNSVD